MKLIDMLVEDGMNGWQWPDGVECITQDNGSSIYKGVAFGYHKAPYLKKNIWLANNGTGHADAKIKKYDVVADDWDTAIITREQYEAALAASKHCDHKWIPSEGRTQSGYLCSKCGNYDGPGYDWIDWPGGECPVPRGTLVDVRYRDSQAYPDRIGTPALVAGGHGATYHHWLHDGMGNDIISYRLHKPQEAEQAEADDEADLNECIGQDATPVWNGEGLPPVGCECEYLDSNNEWYPVTIKYASNQIVVICGMTNIFGEEQETEIAKDIQLDKPQFRPLRSEADRKREEAVKTIMLTGWCQAAAEEIYDLVAAGKVPGMKVEG